MIKKVTLLPKRLKCKALLFDLVFSFKFVVPIFCRLPSIMNLLIIASTNVIFPFVYLSDILKDSIQVGLLVIAAGGPVIVLRYWYSMTSFVSWSTLHINSLFFPCTFPVSFCIPCITITFFHLYQPFYFLDFLSITYTIPWLSFHTLSSALIIFLTLLV